MKFYGKGFIFLLFLIVGAAVFPGKVQGELSVSARSAILMEQETGRVLYEKNPHEKRRVASITKIMTAIIAIESGKLEETVTVSERATRTEGSSIYLKPGEKIKLKHLVYGLMLRSGNDAAVAIAEYVGGSVEGFVFLMNQKSAEIGMKNTNFANPHGLDDSDDHYSTAYDMAILTKYAMENETFREISGTKVYRAPNPGEKWDRVWKNKNRLLTEFYKYSTGGKTGYTKKAGRTLVSTASKNGMDLIAVTIYAPDDWNDHVNMFETAYKKYKMATVLNEGTIKRIDHPFYRKKVYAASEYQFPVAKGEKDLFRIEYKLSEPKREWKGGNIPDIVGKAVIYFEDRPVKELPLYYKKEKKEKDSLFNRFKETFTSFIGVKTNG